MSRLLPDLLLHFSLKPDEKHLIPALKAILALKPNLKILASPWSPPVWMKSNQSTVGGELLEQHFASYAQYFVRYIQGMAAHGIRMGAELRRSRVNPRRAPCRAALERDAPGGPARLPGRLG